LMDQVIAPPRRNGWVDIRLQFEQGIDIGSCGGSDEYHGHVYIICLCQAVLTRSGSKPLETQR
jgi:hypothetical protein